MSAPTKIQPATNKAFFRSLESLHSGDKHALADLMARLVYNEKGLIPVITQDALSGEVLMLAWMSPAALEQTLETGQMTYFSRSRNELWIKGLTSGCYQWLVDIRFDCDGDAILCRVKQEGSACHTGRRSCFYLLVDPAKRVVKISDTPRTFTTQTPSRNEC